MGTIVGVTLSVMNVSLSGKRALVCGSTAGIGRACADALAGLGASVVLMARDENKLAAALQALPAAGGQRHGTLVADLSKPERVRDVVAADLARSGAYHILINNTGGPPTGPLIDATPEQFRAACDSLLLSAHVLTQALVPGMKQARYGRIINIESTSVKQPIPNLGLSNTVRAAVANWAKTLSQELGPFGITVNNILPGYTATERLGSLVQGRAGKQGVAPAEVEKEMVAAIPAGRFGKPEEIAAAAAFLATPAAAYINGVNLPVDGGRLGTL
jgi:3-oxoacyl-[acyl-carrier protein] reductase